MLQSRWGPSPCGRLSRPRTTTTPPPHPDGIGWRRAFPPAGWLLAGKGTDGMVPTFTLDQSTGEVSSYAPATSPRLRRSPSPWPPQPTTLFDRRVPRPPGGCAPLPSPDPSGSSWWSLLRGVQSLVPRVHLPVLLAGPGPSDGAGPSRRCRGCCPPLPTSLGSGCPQLHQPAAIGWRRSRFISSWSVSASWRTMSQLHTWFGAVAKSSGLA